MGLLNITNIIRKHGLREGYKYFYNASRLLYVRYTGKKHFKCKVGDGEYELFLNTMDNGISRDLAIHGKREIQLREILKEEIKEGMCILEIGANIGYYAVWEAIKVGPAGKVYAIEPSPENFELLKQNAVLNSVSNRMEFFNMGIGDKKKMANFFLARFSNLHTFMPENKRGKKRFEDLLTGDTIKIQMTTLSEFCKNRRYPDLIRMDIEGFEVEVFNGAMQLMQTDSRFRPTLIFETHFNKYDDETHSIRNPLRKLFGMGYKMYKASTASERTTPPIRQFGYTPYKILETSEIEIQGLYENIANEHAEKLICDIGGIRDVVLKYCP